MAPVDRTRDLLLWGCLLTCWALGQAFFLPSFSSGSYPKKTDVAAVQWPGVRESVYYGQHYHGGNAVPVAVPYPVAVPAPHAQVAVQPAPPPVSGSPSSFQASYHNMQLVPCLCSVPKDDIDDSSSVVVQSSQQISN
ncbi:uncharacterized protein LOC117282441 [Cryptotermes secundus]|uniref:uncharacterized protein LOC117282441 n=1 Tax=Cryptotermes secundus TaxID=105785 RepID=UPI001454D759|nr:uncharacterized protein LOC117282441 [Cryptotermes secundus]